MAKRKRPSLQGFVEDDDEGLDMVDMADDEYRSSRSRKKAISYKESDSSGIDNEEMSGVDENENGEYEDESELITNGGSKRSLQVKLKIGPKAAKMISERNEPNDHTNGRSDDEDGNDDEDENLLIPRRTRTGRKTVPQSTVETQGNEEEEEDEVKTGRRRTRTTSVAKDEEDEYKDSEEDDEELSDASVSEDVINNKNLNSFIHDDSDDEYNYEKRRKKKKIKRGRPSGTKSKSNRRIRQSSDVDFEDDEDYEEEEEEDVQSLVDELRDLRDEGTPLPEMRKKHLRARKEVNYQILPPAINDEPAETVTFTPSRKGRANAGTIRRLFPTTGPFGGSDVVSIFGGGFSQGPPALNKTQLDSDSSEDEKIRPFGATPGPSSSTGGVAGFGKTKKPGLADSDPLGVDMNIDFSAVGGLDNYINQLKEMVSLPLKYPEIYQRFGVTPPRGVLFHGPPGTGKTLMARALAASCSSGGRKITFFMRKGADCLSKWVGEAERQLRLLFEEARNQHPSIIFFDEIDGLAPVRSSKQEQIHASIVSTLLALMDGMDNRGQVIVIGATNRPDSVDPALRRPGRFDREFYFPLPDLDARKKIISIHTKKWDPPLGEWFTDKIAKLTKGYGGADLRALCTEAALNAIQRRYPQIYMSEEKLLVDPQSIHVTATDFMKSVEKIVPSSARSTSTGAEPLPPRIDPLLRKPFQEIAKKLDHLLPPKKKLSPFEEALHEDFNDEDGGFSRHEAIKGFQSARIFRPRLLIHGESGMGQQYLGAAILHHLEGFYIQTFDLASMLSDSARTPEAAVVQLLVEVKRRAPSVIFMPNVDTWFASMSEAAKSTFLNVLRSISPTDPILVLGLVESPYEGLDRQIKELFGYSSENLHEVEAPNTQALEEFFNSISIYVKSKPTEYPDLENRPKRQLEQLKVAPPLPEHIPTKAELKQQEKKDMQLKNLLKVKLSGLMDLFKNRYKRFKKPPIDDMHLVHLFEPSQTREQFPEQLPGENGEMIVPPPIQHPFVKDGDMILEVATDKKYFNIDLDIIEERLWNGFYSEPKQFLRDIEMIHIDANTTGERDRIVKASEMFANAQVAIEEMGDAQFLQSCKEMHQREIARYRKSLEEREKNAVIEIDTVNPLAANGSIVQVASATEIVEIPATEEANGRVHADANKTTEINVGEPPKAAEDSDVVMEDIRDLPDIPIVTQDLESGESTTVPNGQFERPSEPEPELIISESGLYEFKEKLVNSCKNMSIEQLEQVNASLIDTIWILRYSWDRNIIIKALNSKLDQVLDLMDGELI